MSEQSFDLANFRSRMVALAGRGIYLGTSSWKYAGWRGQIYDSSRYETRGKFANSRFERECLVEYAETFRSVCVDAAYYTFPAVEYLKGMADQVPDGFKFGFKVTEEITVRRYPSMPRYGQRGGTLNEHFLNAPLFVERFLGPMASIRERVGPIIFEFSRFYPAEYSKAANFIAHLDRFFSALPKDWEYSVELRNKAWLGSEYLECLKKHGVAHVFNNWTHMPSVSEQLNIVGDNRTDQVTVARFLLKPGRTYEDAVKSFQPYERTQEVNHEARGAGAVLIDSSIARPTRKGTYIYVNNRLEGNALYSIAAMLDLTKVAASLPRKETLSPTVTSISKTPDRPSAPQLELGF